MLWFVDTISVLDNFESSKTASVQQYESHGNVSLQIIGSSIKHASKQILATIIVLEAPPHRARGLSHHSQSCPEIDACGNNGETKQCGSSGQSQEVVAPIAGGS